MNTVLATKFATHFDPDNQIIEGNTNQDELVFVLIRQALKKLDVRLSNNADIEAVLETVNIYDLLMATAGNDKIADSEILQKYAIEVEGLDEDEIEDLIN